MRLKSDRGRQWDQGLALKWDDTADRTGIWTITPPFLTHSLSYSESVKKGAFLLLMLLLPAPALAQAGEEDPLFSDKTIRRLAKIGVSIVPAKGEALVYVSSGAAAGEIKIVPQPGGSSEDLEAELNEVLRGLVRKGLKVHSSGAFVGRWDKSEIWLRESAVSLPFPGLRRVLQRHAMKPQFVLRAGRHVRMSQDLKAEPSDGSWGCYIVREPKFDLVLSASISGWDAAGLTFFLGWPLAVTIIGLVVGWRLALRKDLTPSQMRRFYVPLVGRSLALAMVPHAIFAFPYMMLGGLDLYTDLWLGGASVSSFVSLLIMLPVLLLSAVSKPWTRFEMEVMGPRQEFAALAEARLPSFEAVTKRHKRLQLLISGAISITSTSLLVFGISTDQRHWSLAGLAGVLLYLVFVGDVLPLGLDPRSRADIPELENAQARAAEIATRLGIKPPRVVPEIRSHHAKSHIAINDGRFLAVNASFAASYDPDEQEYWIARALVTREKGSYDLGRFWAVGVLTLVLCVALALASPWVGWGLFFMAAILPASIIFHMRFNGKKLEDSDVEAVLLTGNLEAAIRAERKLWMLSLPSDSEADAALKDAILSLRHRYEQRTKGASS